MSSALASMHGRTHIVCDCSGRSSSTRHAGGSGHRDKTEQMRPARVPEEAPAGRSLIHEEENSLATLYIRSAPVPSGHRMHDR